MPIFFIEYLGTLQTVRTLLMYVWSKLSKNWTFTFSNISNIQIFRYPQNSPKHPKWPIFGILGGTKNGFSPQSSVGRTTGTSPAFHLGCRLLIEEATAWLLPTDLHFMVMLIWILMSNNSHHIYHTQVLSITPHVTN